METKMMDKELPKAELRDPSDVDLEIATGGSLGTIVGKEVLAGGKTLLHFERKGLLGLTKQRGSGEFMDDVIKGLHPGSIKSTHAIDGVKWGSHKARWGAIGEKIASMSAGAYAKSEVDKLKK